MKYLFQFQDFPSTTMRPKLKTTTKGSVSQLYLYFNFVNEISLLISGIPNNYTENDVSHTNWEAGHFWDDGFNTQDVVGLRDIKDLRWSGNRHLWKKCSTYLWSITYFVRV